MARTKAEIDELRRAFRLGRSEFCLMEPNGECLCGEKAAKAYPYPKETRPRCVTINSGAIYQIRGGDMNCMTPRRGSFSRADGFLVSDLENLARLLDADTLRAIADSGDCGPMVEVEVE